MQSHQPVDKDCAPIGANQPEKMADATEPNSGLGPLGRQQRWRRGETTPAARFGPRATSQKPWSRREGVGTILSSPVVESALRPGRMGVPAGKAVKRCKHSPGLPLGEGDRAALVPLHELALSHPELNGP